MYVYMLEVWCVRHVCVHIFICEFVCVCVCVTIICQLSVSMSVCAFAMSSQMPGLFVLKYSKVAHRTASPIWGKYG